MANEYLKKILVANLNVNQEQLNTALSEFVSTNEQTFSVAKQMQTRKNLGLYYEDVETIEWDGDTEGRKVVPGSTPAYKIIDIDGIKESELDQLIGARIQIYNNGEVRTKYVSDYTSHSPVFGLRTPNDDVPIIYIVNDDITNPEDGSIVERGLYFVKAENFYVKSISVNATHKIDKKFIPDSVPDFDPAEDEGKILKIVNGVLTWVSET